MKKQLWVFGILFSLLIFTKKIQAFSTQSVIDSTDLSVSAKELKPDNNKIFKAYAWTILGTTLGDNEGCNNNSDGGGMATIGGLTYLGGFFFSFIDTGIKASRLQKWRESSTSNNLIPPTLSLSPFVLPTSSNQLKLGLVSTLQF